MKDINPNQDLFSVMAQPFTVIGDDAYFVACDRVHGCELWKSNGTSSGTALLKDTLPGRAIEYFDPQPDKLVAVGNTLFFAAQHPDAGRELWKSDGTPAGTVVVKDIFPGKNGANPRPLAQANGQLYFTAEDPTGIRVWRSDGSSAGTVTVSAEDFRAGYFGPAVASGNLVFFTFMRFGTGTEVWRTDGTSAGTFAVTTGIPGSLGPLVAGLTSIGAGHVVFGAPEAGVQKLWRSDGTVGGTGSIKEVAVGCGASTPLLSTVANGVFYFQGSDAANGCELWRSDGTAAGTSIAYETIPGSLSTGLGSLVSVGGTLYFTLPSMNGGVWNQLWKSDGTQAGTTLVRDFGFGNALSELVAFNGVLVFAGRAALWVSNGTDSGTVVVRDFSEYSLLSQLTAGATRLYFSYPTEGYEATPWTSDLTTAGTVLLKDTWGGSQASYPLSLRDVDGTLFFNADPGGLPSRTLWTSKGTAANTTQVETASTFSGPQFIGAMGSSYYFRANSALYRTDGTSTTLLSTHATFGTSAVNAGSHAVVNGVLLFPGGIAFQESELWRTDGTPAGTRPLVAQSGGVGAWPGSFIAVGDTAYFTTLNELWRSDATEAGTFVLKQGVGPISRAGNHLAFGSGSSLWVTDGAVANTTAIPSAPLPLYFASGTGEGSTYYVAYRANREMEIWKTDGTAGGTALVKAFPEGTSFSGLTVVGRNLFFFVEDYPNQSDVLWRSDGTAAGTVPLKSFFWVSGLSRSIARVHDTLYFSGSDGASGNELWKTDGTPQGTVLAADMAPGSGDGSVQQLTVSGNRLYFIARTEASGHELHAIEFDGTPNPFSFAGVSGVVPTRYATSAPVVISGLEIQVSIRVANGQYSLGCNGSFTAAPGFIEPGQSVCVRHVAAASMDATTTTLLSVGDYTTTFTSRTLAGVLADPRVFAAQQYRDFLGREGEAAGLDYYEQLLASGAISRRQLIEVFLASPEFQDGLPQVTRLYFAFFNRIPDYPGLMFQAAAYRSGAPLAGIALNFALSPEFTATYGSQTNEQYVDLVYQNVLGRPPDAAGRQYYLERLNDARLTRGQVMLGFSESPEFRQLVDDEVYVIAVYVGMLRRTPERAGLDFYTNLIALGMPPNAIIDGFLASPEYLARFVP